jgi:hypothetical protein
MIDFKLLMIQAATLRSNAGLQAADCLFSAADAAPPG